MAIPTKISNRADAVTDAVKNASNLSIVEKDDLIEMICDARDGTNGLSLEDKTQANAENIANLTYLMVLHLISDKPKVSTWKDVIISCRWNIVIIVTLVIELLAIRPQMASIIERFIK